VVVVVVVRLEEVERLRSPTTIVEAEHRAKHPNDAPSESPGLDHSCVASARAAVTKTKL